MAYSYTCKECGDVRIRIFTAENGQAIREVTAPSSDLCTGGTRCALLLPPDQAKLWAN